jgi:hypothetical protein
MSLGTRGARYSINSDGRRTRSVGIPGSGLSWRDQSGPTTRAADLDDLGLPSPTRLTAHTVGVVTAVLFVLAIIEGWSHFAGVELAVGLIAYVALRLLRPLLDPLFVWLVTRNQQG